MKIFLTGATGYTGSIVCQRLIAAGHAIRAIARRIPPRPSGPIEWVQADFADGNAILQYVSTCDAAIHVGASHDKDMERLDGIVIRAIADAFSGTGRTFISTSATPVYGETGLIPRDEAEPILAPHPLRAWRAQHDRDVVALSARNIRSVVIRPGYIYGAAGGLLADMIRVARKTGHAEYIGAGQNVTSTVHIDALAELYVLALDNAVARGVYNAVSDEYVRAEDIAKAVAYGFGPGIEARSIPLEEARKRLGEYADLAVINCVASSLRARRDLNWIPSAPSLLGDLIGGSYQRQPLAPYHST